MSAGVGLAPAVLPGDANVDGKVDSADMTIVLNHFGMINAGWTNGNFDGLATVDLTDLADVMNNFGKTSALAGRPRGNEAAPACGVFLRSWL